MLSTCGKLFSCCLLLLGTGYGGVLEEDQGVPYGQSPSFDTEQQRFVDRDQTERNTSFNVLTYVPPKREENPPQNLIQVSQTEALILSKMEQLMTQALVSLYPERADEFRNFWVLEYIRIFCNSNDEKIFLSEEVLNIFNQAFEKLYLDLHKFLFSDFEKKHDQGEPVDISKFLKAVSNLSDIELIYKIKEDFDRQALQPKPSKLKSFLFDFLGVLFPVGAVLGFDKISEQLEDFLRMRLSYVPDALIEMLGRLPELLVLPLTSYCYWNQFCAVSIVSRSMGIRTNLSSAVWSFFREYLSAFFDTRGKVGIDGYMRFFYLLTREVSRTNTVLYGNVLNLFEQRNWLIKKYLAYVGLLIFDKQECTKEFLVSVLFELMSSIVQRSLSSFIRDSFFYVKISERTIRVRDSSSGRRGYFLPEQTVCMKGSDIEKCLCNSTLLDKNIDGKGILTFFLNPLLSIVEHPLLTTFRHLSFDQKKKFLENGASCYSDIALNSCCIGKILCFFGFFCAKLTVSMVQTFTRFK